MKQNNLRPFKNILFFVLMAINAGCVSQIPSKKEMPKLVVGIVVDQMRFDYLQRFWDQFGEGGFKRLVNQGYSFQNCNFNYVPTETAPGHASIYTGTTPSVHGIIGNNWLDHNPLVAHTSVADPKYKLTGIGNATGCSPDFLLTTTLPAELKIASGSKSKTIGISLKDRSAILPLGKNGDAAFWLDDSTGNWISSSYYFGNNPLPEWVSSFNNKKQPAEYLKRGWKLSHDLSFYKGSNLASDSLYEGGYYPKVPPVFPYHFGKDSLILVKYTPFGNLLIKDLAKEAILNYQLGKGKVTDFLALSFSSTDLVGHLFGINSLELEETYILLDQYLENLFNFIDSTVGKGNTLIFLTADHGAVENPVHAEEHLQPGGWFEKPLLNYYLKLLTGYQPKVDSLFLGSYTNNIYLNLDLARKLNKNPDSLCEVVAQFIRSFPGIAAAATGKQLLLLKNNTEAMTPEQSLIINAMENGYCPARSGEVIFVLKPGFIEWGLRKGTSHGTPYDYDTHVPLLFCGWKIKQGENSEAVEITDIAPTVSNLLGITPPSGCTGKLLQFK